MTPVLPGATLGVLGSGQLGRMLAFEAKRMGYRVHIFSPGEDTPAGQVSDFEIAAPYDDLDAVVAFARGTNVITVEFENIPAATLEAAAQVVPVHPSPEVLYTAQNRLREKRALHGHGLPVTPFRELAAPEDVAPALEALGLPAVMKTAGFGYDGKGQRIVETPEAAAKAFEDLGGAPLILEAFIPYQQEVSVVAARGAAGDYADYGVIENDHENHILDVSAAPSSLPEPVQQAARDLARTVLEALGVVGVMCVELFLTEGGDLLVNEVAPRPHNSGHLTIEAGATSQFAQQLRAVCGLPLGDTELRPAAMANLLGDLWAAGEPDWRRALGVRGAYLHLYGKGEARAGRKMGHVTALGDTAEAARRRVREVRAALAGA